MRLPNSRGCIICGRDNPIGLKIAWETTADGVFAVVTAGSPYQGFGGVLQGGIAAGMMDDAMWWAVYSQDRAITMTADLHVRYKKPVPTDTPLTVTARVTERRRSLYTCQAAITGPDGTVLAEATGKFLTAPKELAAELAAEMVEP